MIKIMIYVTLFFILPAIIMIAPHELFHYIGFRIFGAKLQALYLYSYVLEKENNKLKWRKLSISEKKTIAVACSKDKDYTAVQFIVILAFGPIGNLITAAICFIIYNIYDNPLGLVYAVQSLFMGLFNLIQFFDKSSDGSRIKRLLNKETQKYELADINIANEICGKGTIPMDKIKILEQSNNILYKTKRLYYLTLHENPEIRIKTDLELRKFKKIKEYKQFQL